MMLTNYSFEDRVNEKIYFIDMIKQNLWMSLKDRDTSLMLVKELQIFEDELYKLNSEKKYDRNH